MTLWTDVTDWNTAVDVRMHPTPGWVPDEDIQLALRLIDEEREELLAAMSAGDLVETADAIADGLYVRAGLLLRLGLARAYIDDLLVPCVGAPSWGAINPVYARSVLADLYEYDTQIGRAVDARNLNRVDIATHRSMYFLSNLAVILRIPLDEVWSEVQRSNLAKLVDGKVIRRESDSKILKPENWSAPDIAGVLAQHGWQAAA